MTISLKIPEKLFVVFSLLFFSGAVVLLMQGEQGEGTADSNPVLFYIQTGIYLAFLLLGAYRYPRMREGVRKAGPVWLVVILAVTSFIWSPVPDLALRRSIIWVATTLTGIYLAIRFRPTEQLQILGWTMVAAGILSLAFVLLLPEYGITSEVHRGAWRGVYPHKNWLGRYMALAVLVTAFLWRENKQWRWLLALGLSGLLIVRSDSATSWALVAFLPCLWPLYAALRRERWLAGALVAGILGTLVAAGAWLAVNYSLVLASVSRDATLTGRTILWAHLLAAIERRPLLGTGYVSFWGTQAGSKANMLAGWGAGSSHNSFLDLLLELGWLGLGFFLIGFLVSFRRAIMGAARSRSRTAIWPLLYLTLLIGAGLTESGAFRHNSVFWVLYVAVSVSLVLYGPDGERHWEKRGRRGSVERWPGLRRIEVSRERSVRNPTDRARVPTTEIP